MSEHKTTRLAQANYEHAACALFSSNICRSCSLLDLTKRDRIVSKERSVIETLQRFNLAPESVAPIVLPSNPWGSRSKIKMSVTGTCQDPIIGIINSDMSGVELTQCPLSPKPFQALLETVRSCITSAALHPYQIKERTGELKGVIVMSNRDHSQGILRFILRSSEAISRVRKVVSFIQSLHPWVTVISCNIQPIPAAILEGPEEILLTEEHQITERYGDIQLNFSPQSFMQVTPEVATALYAKAIEFAREGPCSTVLDLFCGVGGFSLSIAPYAMTTTGVELSSMAVESAALSAARLGAVNSTFIAEDVDSYMRQQITAVPELLVVNPPRRGLSSYLVGRINELRPNRIIYSSCNPETFARDVAALTQIYSLKKIALFDMFPLTTHCEVLGLIALR